MLFADATRLIKCKLAGAITTNNLPITGGWSEVVAATAGWTDCQAIHTVTSGVTEITLVGLAASGRIRKLQGLHVQNADTATATFILYYDDETNERVAIRAVLAVNDNLYVADDGSWRVVDSNGQTKTVQGTSTNALLDGVNHSDTVAQAVTRGSLIYGNATPAWTELVIGAASRFLQSDGTDVAWVAMSGDAPLAAGVITVANNAITDVKLRDSGALSVIGRAASTSGDPADISAVAASGAVLRENGGSALGFGTVDTAGITNNAVTDIKLRDSAARTVIGRSANSSGDPADISAVAELVPESRTLNSFLSDDGDTVGFRVVDTLPQDLNLTGDTSPPQITADQNNYNPTGMTTTSVLRLSTDASRNITGMAGGRDGRIMLVVNVGNFDIILKDESGSSTAANRFAMNGDLDLATDQSVLLWYDSTSSRWRLVSHGLIDLVADALGTLPIGNGGTNSSTALNNSRIMVSSAGTIVEAGAMTNGQLLIGSTSAAPVVAALTVNAGITLANGAGTITLGRPALTGAIAASADSNATTETIDMVVVIGDGTNAITTGVKGFLPVDFAFTILQWTLVADASGSIVIDVWRDSYANFPPTVADTIAGTEKPTLVSVQKNQDTTLSTWTTA